MPQDLYSWRCDAVLPMLDEEEWAQLSPLLTLSIENIQRYRCNHDVALDAVPIQKMYWAALAQYREMTGFQETNPLALWHHRVSLYGPTCRHCGNPLRTPEAKLCAACGKPRD